MHNLAAVLINALDAFDLLLHPRLTGRLFSQLLLQTFNVRQREPDAGDVRLVTVPPETVAVRRFTGSRSRRAIAARTAELMTTLRETGFEPVDTPAAWFYDPPWTVPALRRNEIAVPVEPGGERHPRRA